MLVATPQTTSYSLHGNSSTKCRAASATPKNSNSNSGSSKSHKASAATPAAPPSTASSLIKTLSVRLNRGTEFIKGTVQRALISATSSAASATGTNAATAVESSGSVVLAPSASSVTAAAAVISQLFPKRTLPSDSFLHMYTVPPTSQHRYPEHHDRTGSADSLQHEVCHFKPIRAAPITARKSGSRSRGASLKAPTACVAKRKPNCDEFQAPHPYSAKQCTSSSFVRIAGKRSYRSAFVVMSDVPLPVVMHLPVKQRATKQRRPGKKSKHHAKRSRHNAKSGRSKRAKAPKVKNPAVTTAPLGECLQRCNRSQTASLLAMQMREMSAQQARRSTRRRDLGAKVDDSTTPPDRHVNHSRRGKKQRMINFVALSKNSKMRDMLEAQRQAQTQPEAVKVKSRSRKRKAEADVIDIVGEDNNRPYKRTRLTITNVLAVSRRATPYDGRSSTSSAARQRASSNRLTPPLTRSRLREMSELQLEPPLEFKRRCI